MSRFRRTSQVRALLLQRLSSPCLSKLSFCYTFPLNAFTSPHDAIHIHTLTPQLISLLLHNISPPRFCSALLCLPLLLRFQSWQSSRFSSLFFAALLLIPAVRCSRFALPFDAIAKRLSAVRCSCLSAPCIALAGHIFASLLRCHSIRCHALALRIFALPFYSQPLPSVSLPCSCAAFLLSAFAHLLMAALMHC